MLTETNEQYIKSWLREEQPIMKYKLIPTNPLHKYFNNIITEQTTIGWNQAPRGRLALSWHKTQRLYNPTLYNTT